jgi:hypothetical protein
MMQQINLYQTQRLPAKVKQPLSGVTIVAIGLLAILAFGTFYYTEYQQQVIHKNRLAQLKKQKKKQQKQVGELKKKLAQMEKNEQLQRKIELLTAERNQKQLIINRLKDPSYANTKGFSPHLQGLAEQKIPDLWLTGILLERGGTQLLLDGSALQASLVPSYLQRLSSEDAYRGKQLSTFLLERPEEESWRLDFSIGTNSELREHRTEKEEK